MNKSSTLNVSKVTESYEVLKMDKVALCKEEDSDSSNSDLKPVTKTIHKELNIKRNYVNTTDEQRLELIEAVCKHGERVKSAAQRLGINYSAAKTICQIYKSEGRSRKKLPRRRFYSTKLVYKVDETSSEEKGEANKSSLTERVFQLMKKPLIECVPEIQKTQIIPHTFLENSLIHDGTLFSAQKMPNLSIIGVPVVSSQVYSSNVLVMFSPSPYASLQQPITAVSRLPMVRYPPDNAVGCNNLSLSSYPLSIPRNHFFY